MRNDAGICTSWNMWTWYLKFDVKNLFDMFLPYFLCSNLIQTQNVNLTSEMFDLNTTWFFEKLHIIHFQAYML